MAAPNYGSQQFQPATVPVKIAITIGALALLCLHVVLSTTADRLAPHVESLFTQAQSALPTVPRGGINFDEAVNSGGMVNTLPVNSSARDELKRSPSPVDPRSRDEVKEQRCPPGVPCPQPQLAPQRQPQPNAVPQNNLTPLPTTPRYSIELFVLHDDRQSQELLRWFNTDATLQKWRKNVNFNAYSPDNPTYKTRYANRIPTSSFPGVLVSDGTGGHVYLVDRQSLPSDVQTLKSQLAASVERQKSVVSGSSQLSDQLKLMIPGASDVAAERDCSNGQCEPGFLDRLKNRDPVSPVEGLLRTLTRPGEVMLQTIVVIVIAIGIVYFIKRGMS